MNLTINYDKIGREILLRMEVNESLYECPIPLVKLFDQLRLTPEEVQWALDTAAERPPTLAADRLAHLADKELYRRFYNADGAPGSFIPMAPNEPRLLWALNHLRPTDDVVDIGCHKGEITLYLRTHTSGRVAAVDISETALRHSRARFGDSIEWHCAWAEDMPLESDSFDVAVLTEILEHVVSVPDVLREAERVVRPGGLIVLSTPQDAIGVGEWEADTIDRRMGFGLSPHVRNYVPCVDLADKPGFTCVHQARLDIAFHLACYRVEKES